MFKYFITELTIKLFRCIPKVTMEPNKGVNLLYGGNDSGKTTILEAISLIALQDSSIQLVDSDFYMKELENEFEIMATIACEPILITSSLDESEFLSSDVGINHALGGSSAITEITNMKFNLTVNVTKEMKLKYKVSDVVGMSKFEVEDVLNSLTEARIISYEKSDDHLFQKTNLKNTVFLELVTPESHEADEYVVKQTGYVPLVNQSVRVIDFNNSLRAINLPSISNTSKSKAVDGSDLGGLKLFSGQSEIELPLQNFGAGINGIVQQLYEESSQRSNLIQLVDGIEGRLDTTKQSNYLEHICQSSSQVFATVHNSNLINLDRPLAVWVNSPVGNIFQPTEKWPKRFQEEHPDIFKYKLIIIGEGKTEVGFITTILTLALGRHPNLFGIIIIWGHGNQSTRDALEEFLEAGLKVGAMVDLEKKEDREVWDRLNMKDLLCQWKNGCTEENVIPAILDKLPIKRLHEFISHPKLEKTEARLESIAKFLNLTLNLTATPKQAVNQIWEKILKRKDIQRHVGAEREKTAKMLLGKIIVEISSGRPQEGTELTQEHKIEKIGRDWFKSIEGGEELAEKMLLFNALTPKIKEDVMPSVKAKLIAVGETPSDDLPEFNPADAKWCIHVNTI